MRRKRLKCAKAFAHLSNYSYKELKVAETAQITQVLDAMNRSEERGGGKTPAGCSMTNWGSWQLRAWRLKWPVKLFSRPHWCTRPRCGKRRTTRLNIEDLELAETTPDGKVLLVDEALAQLKSVSGIWAHCCVEVFWRFEQRGNR
jgi:hypothetical protein